MPPNANIPNNLEIDKVLKEFELKNQAERTQKTPEVSANSDAPKIVRLAMKWFGLKEQKQAEYALLGFVVVAIGISLFLALKGGNTPKKPPAAVLEMIKQMPVNQ